MTRNVLVRDKRQVGSDGKHLKLTLDSEQRVFDAIAFRQGELASDLPRRVDVAFRFEENEYLGIVTLQLNIQALRPAESI